MEVPAQVLQPIPSIPVRALPNFINITVRHAVAHVPPVEPFWKARLRVRALFLAGAKDESLQVA
jgi:hypothetical protein